MSEIKPKHDDFFHFRFSVKKEPGFDPRMWCFEGLLRAYEVDGKIELRDTYWDLDPRSNDDARKRFTVEEAQQQGTLTFYCNLDDLEQIEEWERCYYEKRDIFRLHSQSGCYQYHFKRKGAQKSKAAMLEEVQRRIDEDDRQLEFIGDRLNRNYKKRKKIESGDLTVSL